MYLNNKFITICQLFGLWPISSNKTTQQILNVYSWLTIPVLILKTIFCFSINVYGDGYGLSGLATLAVFISSFITHIVSIAESLVKRKYLQDFFAHLEQLDDIFRIHLQHKIQLRRRRLKLKRKYFAVLLVVLFAMIVYIRFIVVRTYKGFFWHAILSLIIARMRLIQASIYVELITLRFESLNLLLKQMANCRLRRRNLILDVNYTNFDNTNRILTLKSIYAKLYDVVDCFNQIFALSTLTVLVHFFLDLTCNSYWLLLTMEKLLPSYNFVECSMTLVPLGLLITIYCQACGACVDQSRITKQLVQKMLVSSPNDHANYLMYEFILQIDHHPIVFQTKRIFCVDLKLLQSMFTSLLGYLVVLKQFRHIENEL